MKKKNIFNLILLISFISAISLAGQTTDSKITVNTSESKINWKGKKPTGEHIGYVKISSGELAVKNNEITGGSFIIDMKSITDTDLKDEGSNKRLVNHLKSADFFDVEKFPTAKFVILNATKKNNNAGEESKATHRVEGDLTVKGVTKKISFDASINLLNGKFSANTPEFTINRTEWGVNYQSKSVIAGLKDQFIYDDITLSIELISK